MHICDAFRFVYVNVINGMEFLAAVEAHTNESFDDLTMCHVLQVGLPVPSASMQCITRDYFKEQFSCLLKNDKQMSKLVVPATAWGQNHLTDGINYLCASPLLAKWPINRARLAALQPSQETELCAKHENQ